MVRLFLSPYEHFQNCGSLYHGWGQSGGSVVKNLPAMQETQVHSLGQEDSLEKEMATYSSTLA